MLKKLNNIGLILLALLIFSMPSAYGAQTFGTCNGAGFSDVVQGTNDQYFYGYGTLGGSGLFHDMKGTANLNEEHYTSDRAGDYAEVGVQIRGADRNKPYTYSYQLYPDRGDRTRANNVWASETLNVPKASYISAYALAINRAGYSAGASTTASGFGSSLIGYSNKASASADGASAVQSFGSASGSLIQTNMWAGRTQLQLYPLELKLDYIGTGTSVTSGSTKGYSGSATASADKLEASEHIDRATGAQIQTQSAYANYVASIFGGVKSTTVDSVGSTFAGTLKGYDSDVLKTSALSQAMQTGHVTGTFTSTATAGTASKTRTSDYGADYDINMQAKTDSTGSSATGVLGYYVDPGMVGLVSGKGVIQGAVDTAQAGDTVNAAAGLYNENVALSKPITLAGAGSGDDSSSNTIIKAVDAAAPVIAINAGGVVVKNLQVTGATTADTGSGIAVRGTGDIDGVTLQNIASKDNFYGLYIKAGGNTISNINANGIVVSGSSEDGVYVEATGSGSIISNLNLNGAQISNSVGSGLDVQATNNGMISDMSAKGILISAPTANGVLLYVSGAGVISNLNLDNSKITNAVMDGVSAHASEFGQISEMSLNGALISNSGHNGVNFFATQEGQISGTKMNGAIISNSGRNGVYAETEYNGHILDTSLNGAQILNSGGNGLEAYVSDQEEQSISGISLDNAKISNSGLNGINTHTVDVQTANGNAYISNIHMNGGSITGSVYSGLNTKDEVSGVVINDANIYGNGVGVNNGAASYIDATNNWWGPGGSGANSGKPGEGSNNGVVGNVYYDPWKTSQIT